MKKSLILLCLAFCAQTAAAQASDAYSTQQAKDAATGMASLMRGTSPTFTNGEVRRDANGNAVVERTSGASTSAQMDYFKNVTGVGGATVEGAGRDGTLGARTTTTTYVDFSCKSEATSRKSTGGYVFELQGCAQSGNVVASVTLRMCSALQRGGVCEEDRAFSAPVTLAAGTFATQDGVQLGLGCNDTNAACRLTVSAKFSMTTRTADYDQTVKAKAAAAGNDENSAQGLVTAMRTKTNEDGTNAYDTAMATDGRALVDCTKENAKRTDAGLPALTCDGKQAVQVESAPPADAPGVDCSAPSQCVRTGTKTTSFTRSCTRTYPLTSQVCEMKTETRACDITWVDSPTEKDANGAPVKVESSSCAPADLEGASKFGSKDTTCGVEHTELRDGQAVKVCDKYNRTDFYAWPPKATGLCFGSPYKVGGNCTGAAETSCPAGNWFGRTKSDTECTLTFDDRPPLQVGESVIAGCGVCPTSQSATVCYAATPLERDPLSLTEVDRQNGSTAPLGEVDESCSRLDLTSCALSSAEPETNNDSGMVTSRRENYTCTAQSESCLEYAPKDARCQVTTVDNFGLDKAGFRAGASDEAMNSALANTAVLNSIGAAATDGKLADGASIVPLLFNGEAQDCEKPTGSWGSNGYYQDCCRLGLERPGKQTGKTNECMEDDARLATARRANYTVFIGKECVKKAPWPLSSCIREREVYCAFPGVLPRLIHEQGRKQLADMAKSGGSAQVQKAQVQFPYYGTTGTWSAPVQANGVRLAAWQWPAYCSDLEQAAKVLEANPLAKECPTRLTNYFAVCDDPKGCGELPEYPELGSERWRLTTADPLQPLTTAVSSYAVVHGACDPASSQCSYEMSAWPAGVGGRAVVRKQLSFPLFVAEGSEAQANVNRCVDGASGGSTCATIGDRLYLPVSVAVAGNTPPTSLPATVRLRYSTNNGQSWSALEVPTGNNTELALPGSDAKLSGRCQLETNHCDFTITGTATVKAMSWGTVQAPNCAGFTPDQLSVLDFGKMDLTEWLSTVAANVKGSGSAGMAAAASNQMSEFNQNFQSGTASTVTMAAPQGHQFARVSPAEGFGPFDVTLKVGGYWPVTYGDPAKDTDMVTGVSVDWGDCTAGGAANFVTPVGTDGKAGRGFTAVHRYTRPQDVPVACGGGPRNLTRSIKLRVSTTKSGVQTVTLQVKNAYNTMPGAYQTNTGGSVNHTPTSSATIPATTPPPGR